MCYTFRVEVVECEKNIKYRKNGSINKNDLGELNFVNSGLDKEKRYFVGEEYEGSIHYSRRIDFIV